MPNSIIKLHVLLQQASRNRSELGRFRILLSRNGLPAEKFGAGGGVHSLHFFFLIFSCRIPPYFYLVDFHRKGKKIMIAFKDWGICFFRSDIID